MRIQLEKYFQCERYHKQVCQKSEEHVNQTCEKGYPNQHQQAEKQKEGEAVIYLDDASTKHLTLLVIPKSRILLV
jgi:hypothetical protein